MEKPTTDRIVPARREFEDSLRDLRSRLESEWGVRWRTLAIGALVVAAAVGFGVGRRVRGDRREPKLRNGGA